MVQKFGRFAIAALTAATLLASPAFAADWPTRPVTIVVTMGAGGNTDLLARLAAEDLSKAFGQTFVVENKPSAGGIVASQTVANAAPDGYTILFCPSSAVTLTPLVQKMPFDPAAKLVPVTNVATGAQVIAVKRSLPVTTLAEFFAYAKANPGKLNFAAAGTNNLSHLMPLLMFKKVGVDVVMVPSRAEPQAISDLIAGQVDFYYGNASILLQYKDNPNIRLLAIGNHERVAAAPDLPVVADTIPGFTTSSWNGFMVPAGTPEEIIEKIRRQITVMVQKPEMIARLNSLGVAPGGQTKAQVEETFKLDRLAFGEAVKAAGYYAAVSSLALTGKVALVTGGASGIGAAVAAELAARGATVAITDIDEAKLDAAKAQGFIALRVDNRDVAAIKAAVAALQSQAGGIDILVNNAGISGFSILIEDTDEQAFTAMMDTHVKGAFFWTQAIVPGMKAKRSGRIINMSSNFSLTGSPNMSHYVAAKSALLGLTKAWAREFAPHGVTVNALAPGLIDTPLTQRSLGPPELAARGKDIPLGRLAMPEEIAYAVAWLAGPEAAMMTGQVMSPNGGASIVGI